METTIALTRMILGGVFDQVPQLQVIVAHAGGTLPYLAGRIKSCIQHDGFLFEKYRKEGNTRKSMQQILSENILLDAVVYGPTGVKAAVDAVGVDRAMFGTDHPFFPPLGEDNLGEARTWESVKSNVKGVLESLGHGSPEAKMVLGGNALKILRLEEG